MAHYRIAVRYADSLFGLAIEKGKVEDVKKDIDLFLQVCRGSRPFLLFIRNPVIPNHRKSAILRLLFDRYFDRITMGFADIVTRKNRVNILVEISELFLKKYRDYKGIVTADLRTAIPLDSKTRETIIRTIKNSLGKEKQIELVEKVNRELIGGYILTIGDRQIDDSVNRKLKIIRHTLIV
jgi:F-type H+-transporting ATPase subunit delta